MIIPFGLALGMYCREFSKRFLYVFSSVIMVFALFYSLSREGTISFLLSFILFSSSIIYRKTGFKSLIIANASVILLISYIVYSGMMPSSTSPSYAAGHNLLATVGDFWIAGTGLGTFPFLPPFYENGGMVTNHAYNIYLEFFIEVGLIGSTIIATFLLVILKSVLTSKYWRSRDYYFLLAGLSSLMAIAIHSLVDFNLYITSNAIIFSITLGILYGMAGKGRKWQMD